MKNRKMFDVTERVVYGEVDGYLLPIMKCTCGQQFDHWDQVLPDICDGDVWECPTCHHKFVFSHKITIYEIIENETGSN